jgi:ubiquitin-protein ligase
MKEVKDFCKEKADGVSAFPCANRGILFWKAKIVGAAGTPYAGQTYELQMEFPEVISRVCSLSPYFFLFLKKLRIIR